MATAGSFAYFWEELAAPSDVRRERFDRGAYLRSLAEIESAVVI